ncbi:hypothetical protein JCM15519_10100 [Fundidesulfovibrio butyratiphilus]
MEHTIKEGEDSVRMGVEQFDTLLNPKGFPCGSTIVFAGYAGCGKTTFLMQFLRQGVKESLEDPDHRDGEPISLFISLEESALNILSDYRNWDFGNGQGFDLYDAVVSGRLVIYDGVHHLAGRPPDSLNLSPDLSAWFRRRERDPLEFMRHIQPYGQKLYDKEKARGEESEEEEDDTAECSLAVSDIIRQVKTFVQESGRGGGAPRPRLRVGIDSIMPLLAQFGASGTDESLKARKELLSLKQELESQGVTSIFTAEASPDGGIATGRGSRLGDLERFIARGVLLLGYRDYGTGELVRTIRILKMRGRKHFTAPKAYSIDRDGIQWIGEVFSDQ